MCLPSVITVPLVKASDITTSPHSLKGRGEVMGHVLPEKSEGTWSTNCLPLYAQYNCNMHVL